MAYAIEDYLSESFSPVLQSTQDLITRWWQQSWAQPQRQIRDVTYVPYVPAPSNPTPAFYVTEVPDRFGARPNPVKDIWETISYTAFRGDPALQPLWDDLTRGNPTILPDDWNSFRYASGGDFPVAVETLGFRVRPWLGKSRDFVAKAAKVGWTLTAFTPQGRAARLAWWVGTNLAWHGAYEVGKYGWDQYKHSRSEPPRNPRPPAGRDRPRPPERPPRHRRTREATPDEDFSFLAFAAPENAAELSPFVVARAFVEADSPDALSEMSAPLALSDFDVVWR